MATKSTLGGAVAEPEFAIPLPPPSRTTRTRRECAPDDPSLAWLAAHGLKFGRPVWNGRECDVEFWPVDMSAPRELWTQAQFYRCVPDGAERQRIIRELDRATTIEIRRSRGERA